MRRLEPVANPVTIDLEGQPLQAKEGESVATALLANGETVFARSVKYHRPRGPFCMSGACSHCLMRVDGAPNTYTCQTKVKPGMKVERQNAYPSADVDVFGALDWLFPKGMDHHSMFAGVPVAEQVMAKVARHLAGLGTLPDKPAPERMPCETVKVKIAVAGGGASGSAAARELAAAGAEFLLLERANAVGGRLVSGPVGPNDPPLSSLEKLPQGRVRLAAVVIGLYDDADGRYLAAVQFGPEGPRLLKVYAEQLILCTGGYPAMWPYENNDLPGVFASRAVARLIRREKLLPGKVFALFGMGAELLDTARLVREAGGEVALELDLSKGGEPLKAQGRTGVRGFTWKDSGGKTHKTSCDAVVQCTPVQPAYELARQGGAELRFEEAHEGFVVEADADGRTRSRDVFVAGELLRPMSAAESAASGARAAKALLGGRS